MNYPYNQHIIFIILCKLHVRHVSQVSDLRPLRPLVVSSPEPKVGIMLGGWGFRFVQIKGQNKENFEKYSKIFFS